MIARGTNLIDAHDGRVHRSDVGLNDIPGDTTREEIGSAALVWSKFGFAVLLRMGESLTSLSYRLEIVNAGKLRVTGSKATDRTYYRHTGYPGGIYETNFLKMQQRFPGRALEKAVKGMLPKGPLGYAMIKKLKVYAEATHPHAAQQPKALELKQLNSKEST